MVSSSQLDASGAPEFAVVINAGDLCAMAVFLNQAVDDDARSFVPRPYLGCIPSINGTGVATAVVSLALWDDRTAMVMVLMGVDLEGWWM